MKMDEYVKNVLRTESTEIPKGKDISFRDLRIIQKIILKILLKPDIPSSRPLASYPVLSVVIR